MEISTGLILIICLAALYFVLRKKNKIEPNKNTNLKEIVRKTFPKYRTVSKNGMIMICEINHRNELDELVFIRISPYSSKNIKQSGRMLIVDYPKNPTVQELKRDIGRHLN